MATAHTREVFRGIVLIEHSERRGFYEKTNKKIKNFLGALPQTPFYLIAYKMFFGFLSVNLAQCF